MGKRKSRCPVVPICDHFPPPLSSRSIDGRAYVDIVRLELIRYRVVRISDDERSSKL